MESISLQGGTMKKTEIISGWLIWFLSSLFMFYKYAIEVSPSVMTNELMSTFNIHAAQLGNLAACYFYAYLIMQLPAGILVDRYGPRLVTTLAIFLCATGALIFAYSELLVFAEIGRFLTGVGAAFAAINTLKLIANWFPNNRFAFMAGLMMTLAMLGAVGGQAPLSAFIHHLGTWRHAMGIIALIGGVLAVLFWLVVRDRAKSLHPFHDVNLTPKRMKVWESLKKILSNSQSWHLSFYSGLAFAPVMIFGGLWGVPFIMEAFNLSKDYAARSVSLIFIGFALGAPFSGWLSDWLGNRRNVMFFGTILAFFSITTILYVPGLNFFLINTLMFFFGFFISFFLICFTMIREINPPILAATAIGFMNAFDAFFGAFSDPLTGKFLDLGWEGKIVDGAHVFPVHVYKMALLTIPIYLVLSLIFLFFVKETHCKSSYPAQMP
ncbi:MAG TPA: MFS transporter [Rhabdochlamydiaceae bacterium]|nr:MFS transporter [Rhabdochlamydiaceae bacterium]